MRLRREREKILAAPGVRARERHPDRAAHVAAPVELVADGVRRTAVAVAAAIAILRHEVGDDAVEADVGVVAGAREAHEVVDGERRVGREELERDRAPGGAQLRTRQPAAERRHDELPHASLVPLQRMRRLGANPRPRVERRDAGGRGALQCLTRHGQRGERAAQRIRERARIAAPRGDDVAERGQAGVGNAVRGRQAIASEHARELGGGSARRQRAERAGTDHGIGIGERAEQRQARRGVGARRVGEAA